MKISRSYIHAKGEGTCRSAIVGPCVLRAWLHFDILPSWDFSTSSFHHKLSRVMAIGPATPCDVATKPIIVSSPDSGRHSVPDHRSLVTNGFVVPLLDMPSTALATSPILFSTCPWKNDLPIHEPPESVWDTIRCDSNAQKGTVSHKTLSKAPICPDRRR